MTSLETLKQEIKKEASENPDKFFATDVLREKGFHRGKCSECGMYFWSADPEREVCGEPECGDGYTFINDSPTDEELSYVEAWKEFSRFMEKRGYSSIDRYPVVARWRDDVEFTGASIYCFQPYVVSGEAEPPSDELVIPQPSLRFNDVDNVGITGRHYTNFTMIGQTCFQSPEDYERDRYFRDMFDYTSQILGIPEEKMIFHEESWGGGGNLGPCMECFIDGLELWNQVYMLYEQTPEGYSELDLQVLDMGMGQERITWLSRGTETSYESVMPETLEKMKGRTGLEIDQEIWEKFLPHSSELNIDEVDDIDQKWREIAGRIDIDVNDLKDEIKPAAALYSVAEHSRALNYALADGKIPSNTGAGHNLRMIYRRAQDFIEKYDWDLDMKEVARWNAKELEGMFPELLDSIDQIQKILEVEKRKYDRAREKAQKKLDQLDHKPELEEMVELYESHGVSPEMMEEKGIEVPEDFYTRLGEDDETVRHADEKFDLENIEKTEKMYYRKREPYGDGNTGFHAQVLETRDEWVILDRTMFYPQGGGQMQDTGIIADKEVTDVQKQGDIILHRVPNHDLDTGDEVKAEVDGERRKQLTQHHTSTHMVNAASREVLGDHIYQAGASKKEGKARLDITHFEKPEDGEVREIEEKVCEWIEQDRRVNAVEMPKSRAEQKHGFRIYQGGAPPGNTIRLIEIEGVDIEACGGTHLKQTGNAEDFIITGTSRIQDGVVRLEYKAGKAAREHMEAIETRIEELEDLMDVEASQGARETQKKLCGIFSVEPEQLLDTVERFLDEVEENRSKATEIAAFLGEDLDEGENLEEGSSVEKARKLYNLRKQTEKNLEEMESGIEKKVEEALDQDLEMEIPTENVGLLIQIAKKLSGKQDARITLVGKKGAVSASGNDLSAREALEKYSENVQGDDGFAKAFDV